jgi:hypothetical protein
MKKFVLKHTRLFLCIFASVCAAVFIYASQQGDTPSHLQDLWLNVAASFVVVVVTLSLIEVLQKAGEKARWLDAKRPAREDINFLANASVSYVASVLGLSVNDNKYANLPRGNELSDWSDRAMVAILKDVLDIDLNTRLTKLSAKDWRRMETNMNIIKQKIDDVLHLYNNLMPPTHLAKIYQVRRKLNAFFMFLDVAPSLVTEGDGGDPKKASARAFHLQTLSELLKEYFIAVEDMYQCVYGSDF